MIFLTVYFNPKNKCLAGFAGLILGTGAAVAAITYMNSVSAYEGVYGLIMILIYIIYSSLFLKGDIHTKVFIAGCADCVICISSLLSLLTASMIFGFDYNSMLDFSIYRVGIIVLAKLILVRILHMGENGYRVSL